MRARWRFDLPTALAGALLVHIQFFISGRFFGDLGDARLTVVSYEHWYGFLRGTQPLAGGLFFHPATSIVGLTDAFVVPGIVHSLFRVLGFGLLGAWALTNAVLIFAGLLGAARVARWLVPDPFPAALLVLGFATAYAFQSQLNHLQTVGYLSAFWLLIWARVAVSPDEEPRRRRRALLALAYGVPLLALTTWYAFALGGLIAALLLVVGLIVVRGRIPLRGIDPGAGFWAGLVGTLPLWALWVVIYRPAFGSLSRHPWAENAYYLPRPSDLLNATSGAWGFEPAMYRALGIGGHYTHERAMGVPLLLAIAVVIATATLMLRRKTLGATEFRWLTITLVVAVATYLTMVLFPDGFSLWRLIRAVAPGAESLRAPFRIAIYGNWLLLGVLARLSYRLVPKWTWLVLLLIIADSWRIAPVAFTADEFMPRTFTAISDQLRGCNAFYLRPDPQQSESHQQVDAMVIAELTGVPTVNGYSGNFPPGWPAGFNGYWGPVTDDQLREWLAVNGTHETLCVFDAAGNETAKLTT